MRLDKLDLNLFVVFDALYREGGVTKVAVLLNITQPAVSNALSRLRKMFNDPLFIRTPSGMRPTPVADSIIADVRQALGLLGKSLAVNSAFEAASSEKVFTIGMTDLGQLLCLPRLQQRLAALAPEITLNSYYLDRDNATEALRSGSMDLLIDALLVNAKELEHQQLLSTSYVVAMRPDHPLAHGGLTLEQYLSARHIHVSSRQRGRGQVDLALHALGQQRQLAMRVENYLVAAQVASQTDLLWAAPAALADSLGLHSVPLPFAVEALPLHVYWSKNCGDDPANRWMREQLFSLFGEY